LNSLEASLMCYSLSERMSAFRVILWPIINLLKLTGVMPLTMKSSFSASKFAQSVSVLMIVTFVTCGSVGTVKFILRTSTSAGLIQNFGAVLTILSAVLSIYYLVLKAGIIAECLNDLEVVFKDLKNVNVTRLTLRLWIQFFILHTCPLMYKIRRILKMNNHWAFSTSIQNLFLPLCNAFKANCLNGAVVFFLTIGQIINELYKAILKDLKLATSISNTRKRKERLLVLKNHHGKMYESAEKLNSLFGILLLVGLVTSNIFFQTTVFKFFNGMCSPKGDRSSQVIIFLQSMIFMTADLGRIGLSFVTCHSVSKQVFNNFGPYLTIFQSVLFLLLVISHYFHKKLSYRIFCT